MMKWAIFVSGMERHKMPCDDDGMSINNHEQSMSCWCAPARCVDDNGEIFVHHDSSGGHIVEDDA